MSFIFFVYSRSMVQEHGGEAESWFTEELHSFQQTGSECLACSGRQGWIRNLSDPLSGKQLSQK